MSADLLDAGAQLAAAGGPVGDWLAAVDWKALRDWVALALGVTGTVLGLLGFLAGRRNLGNVLEAQKRLDEAEASYRRALELDPGYAVAHNNLGNVLEAQKRLGEAEASYRRSLELDPDGPAAARGNLEILLRERGRPE